MSASSPLLSADDPPVFTVERAQGASPFVLTCDHAGREIPRKLARLGFSEHELSTHVAWDLGVAELGRRLSARLNAFLILHSYSRLVIDPNRPPSASDSIPVLSERTRIAANEGLSSTEARERFEQLVLPYHQRLSDELDARSARACPSVLVALHSFTPVYLNESRPWRAGVLYGREPRFGRLAGTQAVISILKQRGDVMDGPPNLWTACTMFDVVVIVADAVRDIERRDAAFVESGEVSFNASFIVGGQIKGEPPRLFRSYAEGNFIEAGEDTPFLQTGEAKYGKPIIDRVISPTTTLPDATKCILVSFDSTVRSNLSVGMPIDLVCYERDNLKIRMR